MKPARIFTPVWGAEHIEDFRRGCVRSLTWPRNLAALRECVSQWEIFTTQADLDVLHDIAEPLGIPIRFDIVNTNAGVDRGRELLRLVLGTMKRCVDNEELFGLVMPDIIYGDGSWSNMLALAQRVGVCVTAPHMRVLPSMLDVADCAPNVPLSNSLLFWHSLNHAHPTWTDAEVTKSPGSQFYGGVVWERVEQNLYLVQHRIPNCWAAKLNESDLDFMRQMGGFGMYDHDWPRKLVTEERSRIIGSSDAAFMVEVTPAHVALAPMKELAPVVDLFHRQDVHHSVYRQFVSVWRAG